MRTIKYEIKEKELAELILNNLNEDIKDYDYKLIIKGQKFIFIFKKKAKDKRR